MPDAPWTRYGSTEAVAEFYRRAIERLSVLPGAAAATSNASLHFGGLPDVTKTVIVEGQAVPLTAAEQPFVNYQVVSPNYFEVMGVPLRAGRAFNTIRRARRPSRSSASGLPYGSGLDRIRSANSYARLGVSLARGRAAMPTSD